MADGQLPSFGVVAEGPCDIELIRHLLAGFLGSPDVDPRELQPKPGDIGGWTKVLRYCASEDFRVAFAFVDRVIVHIDTDDCDKLGYDVSRRAGDGRELTVEELIAGVRDRLARAIGEPFYTEHADRILFAVAVHATDCWLLPAAFPSQPGKAAKTRGCLNALNQVLNAKAGFSIDPNHKQVRFYREAIKALDRKRKLHTLADKNPSLGAFVRELERARGAAPKPSEPA